jgi:putative oxidoreductase
VNTALLVLRLTLGAVFLAHGVKHLRGREKTTNWFASMGWRYAPFQWFMSTATELGVGALMVVGFLTAPAAAGIAGIMFVAYLTVHRKAGFWITARPDEGWEYVFTLTAMALAVAMIGPGEWSVDHAVDLALDGWLGLAFVAGGLAAGVGQVAAFFRPPPSKRLS